MLAAHYTGNGTVVAVDAEPRSPGPAEVQLAVAYTGICGTDLHILHGAMDSRVSLPAVLGHEMAGRIVAFGDDVTDWAVGDPVTVMPLRWCGQCPACRAGHSHVCHHLNFVGIDSAGSLQQLWTVPAELLVRLPEHLSLQHAALVEPTAVAVHDVRRSSVEPGEKAVVVGGGPVGLLIASVARASGADVMVLEIDPFRRSVLENVGLLAVDPTTADVSSHVDDWTHGAGAAMSFEVSGSQSGLDSALEVLGVRGRLVVVGIHAQRPTLDVHRVFWRELCILGARVYQRQDVEQAIALVSDGLVPVGALVSRVEPLSSVADAFVALESGRAMKVLVDCRPT